MKKSYTLSSSSGDWYQHYRYGDRICSFQTQNEKEILTARKMTAVQRPNRLKKKMITQTEKRWWWRTSLLLLHFLLISFFLLPDSLELQDLHETIQKTTVGTSSLFVFEFPIIRWSALSSGFLALFSCWELKIALTPPLLLLLLLLSPHLISLSLFLSLQFDDSSHLSFHSCLFLFPNSELPNFRGRVLSASIQTVFAYL